MTMTMTDAPHDPGLLHQLTLDGLPRGNPISTADLAALVECFLLVAADPPTIEELALAAEVPSARIEAALAHLQSQPDRGWIVQRHGNRVQLATAPRFAAPIRRFLGLDREARLSAAALETLAIIAYQQPATRAEIEAVRGVDCSGVLATLHSRGLIESVGKRATIGNPLEYGTTSQFLRHFGLTSLTDLPDLGMVDEQDVGQRLRQLASNAGEVEGQPAG